MNKGGFTLAELMVSVTIMVIVVTAVLAGFVYVLQSGNLNNSQTTLDMDVHKAVDNLRSDLRLSAMNRVVFYPAGAGPYSAISFPMATPNETGALTYGTNGLIQWDKTVIYHVWSSLPNQLRKTVFSPRNNARTDAELQEQLKSVVLNGNGSYTLDSGSASTRVIFNNLVNWVLYPQQAQFDGYNAVAQRCPFNLGSILLTAGTHQFTFTTTGKNAASSGFKIGMDTLVVSPCGMEREAEAQTVSAQSGATAAADYMANGGWSGNYQLTFPATASNQYFTLAMDNDRWEETNFSGNGALYSNTTVKFDTTLSPNDFVAGLEGPGTSWQASDQTLDASTEYSGGDALRACAVRVLLRGKDMLNGGCIKLDGATHWVYFQAATNAALKIMAAYIADADNFTNYTSNAVDTGIPLLFGGFFTGTTIPAGGTDSALPSGWVHTIDKNKSYLISFLVADSSGQSDAAFWRENNADTPGCWILPGSLSPNATMTRQANWTVLGAQPTNLLFGVSSIYTSCPTNGNYISQVVDTHNSTPTYSTISWHSDVPSGSTLKLRVRSASTLDAITNAAWSSTVAATAPSGSSSVSAGSGRYIQFQALFTPDSVYGQTSPRLKDVTIAWNGGPQVVDVGGYLSQGPDYGVYQLTVDGKPLLKGFSMDMTIYQDVPMPSGGKRRVTSTVTSEICPRNTGM